MNTQIVTEAIGLQNDPVSYRIPSPIHIARKIIGSTETMEDLSNLEGDQKINYSPNVTRQLSKSILPQSNIRQISFDIKPSMIIRSSSVETRSTELSSIDGAVVEINDDYVVCNIYAKKGALKIMLPKVLFKDEIQYGTPIHLKIVDIDGVRMPIVQSRSLNASDKDELDKELASLVSDMK
jgi:hypothetical protein